MIWRISSLPTPVVSKFTEKVVPRRSANVLLFRCWPVIWISTPSTIPVAGTSCPASLKTKYDSEAVRPISRSASGRLIPGTCTSSRLPLAIWICGSTTPNASTRRSITSLAISSDSVRSPS